MSPKSLLFVIFLLLTLIASLVLVFRTTVFFGKAYTRSDSNITLQNSYLFASPLQAKADSKELIRITVFVLDGRGLGVSNQKIELIKPQTLSLQEIQSTTDDTGKAVFDLSSPTPGKFDIAATVGGVQIPQKVRISFY